MITFDDITEEDGKKFRELVDQCILAGADDPELKEGFEQIDKWASERGVDVYEMFLNLYAVDEARGTLKDMLKKNGEKDGQ